MYISHEPVLSLYLSLRVPSNALNDLKTTFFVVMQTDIFLLLLHVFVEEQVHVLAHCSQDIFNQIGTNIQIRNDSKEVSSH